MSDALAAGSAAGAADTIAAIATASGRGALAVVRASGPGVRVLARALCEPVPTEARRAVRCEVRDADGRVLDDAVAVLYLAPASFTGEDTLELTTHGGLVAPVAVLAAMIASGAREAEPGEFTRRAVLNGRMDVLQAEAVGDLIDARSAAAHRAALRQLDGGLTRRAAALRERVIGVEALLAYDIDFPEEDDGPVPRARILEAARAALAETRALLATSARGTLVHEGALVVLAGPPNAGKSSLFNALLGESRAIVTEVPGTTRDAIEAVLERDAWPLRLVDTAGLRPSADVVERLGIEASSRYLARAAVVLACADDDAAVAATEALVRAHTEAPVVQVRTKCDLVANSYEHTDGAVRVSALTGAGLDALLARVDGVVRDGAGGLPDDAPGLTRARHRVAVERAAAELAAFVALWGSGALPAPAAATHVHAAAEALGELIGAVSSEQILDVVFRNFCVGK